MTDGSLILSSFLLKLDLVLSQDVDTTIKLVLRKEYVAEVDKIFPPSL